MSLIYLGLGSNQGDKLKNIEKALALITERVGKILTLSDFYETLPWGYDSPETYLNAVAKVEMVLSPEDVLLITQAIERVIGRQEKTKNGVYHDRLIDIDILLYDNLILQTPELTIPHSFMHQREFVLQPLSQIAPSLIHPVFGKSILELLEKLGASSNNI